jgi:hypothetical protein
MDKKLGKRKDISMIILENKKLNKILKELKNEN